MAQVQHVGFFHVPTRVGLSSCVPVFPFLFPLFPYYGKRVLVCDAVAEGICFYSNFLLLVTLDWHVRNVTGQKVKVV